MVTVPIYLQAAPSAHCGDWPMAPCGALGTLPLLCGSPQHPRPKRVSLPRHTTVAKSATTPQRQEETRHLDANGTHGQTLASHTENPAPLSEPTTMRHNLRQEPSAAIPHARIRGGGWRQLHSLLRPMNIMANGDSEGQDPKAEAEPS